MTQRKNNSRIWLSIGRFVRACRRMPFDRTPVWFLRRAGRYMPKYMQVRKRLSLLHICWTPEPASEVTITAAGRLGVDAAIIFVDLLLPLADGHCVRLRTRRRSVHSKRRPFFGANHPRNGRAPFSARNKNKPTNLCLLTESLHIRGRLADNSPRTQIKVRADV
jgi:hypothetical protein